MPLDKLWHGLTSKLVLVGEERQSRQMAIIGEVPEDHVAFGKMKERGTEAGGNPATGPITLETSRRAARLKQTGGQEMILWNSINASPDRQPIADRAALSRVIFDTLDLTRLDPLIGCIAENRTLKPMTHRVAIDSKGEMRKKVIVGQVRFAANAWHWHGAG